MDCILFLYINGCWYLFWIIIWIVKTKYILLLIRQQGQNNCHVIALNILLKMNVASSRVLPIARTSKGIIFMSDTFNMIYQVSELFIFYARKFSYYILCILTKNIYNIKFCVFCFFILTLMNNIVIEIIKSVQWCHLLILTTDR